MTKSEECWGMVDKEGISMMLNNKSKAMFWENEQKIAFNEFFLTSWKAGDKVAYMTAGLVW